MLQMNGNYPRNFNVHELVLHSAITIFCSNLISQLEYKRAKKGQCSLSYCHLMATLVGMTFPVKVVDGYWHRNFNHSWVETKWGSIIDVSPIACRSLPLMYPGVPLKDKGMLNWRMIFISTKKNDRRILEIRESVKFKRLLREALAQTAALRKKYFDYYLQSCKEHNIKPLSKRLFYFSK